MASILSENYSYLKENHSELLKLTIKDVCVGGYMLAVELSDGSQGMASFEPNAEIHCDKKNRDFGEFTPLQIKGRTLLELFECKKNNGLPNGLRVAALNAISVKLMDTFGLKVIRETDPIDLLDLSGEKVITIVGAFHSYIKKVSKTKCHLNVLELNEEAMLPEHRQYFVPAHKYTEVLPKSDIIVITGLTIVNNTLDDLLLACNDKAQVIITGPSSNLIPQVLFEKHIDIIGGTLISKPELLFPLISQGAAGYHLFTYCAEKICILNEKSF
ncbi:MAG: DUF364 domain-containing protein [Salinivirgaceae bacterium]|nr:DUF364 domain-containing protein [Salinivirgaceae bacterium]